MTAELAHEYVQPNGGLAVAQGGMHVTPSGNAVIGWGTVPEISEFAEDGTLLFHAAFNDGTARNYRAYKFPWVGKPSYGPKLLAYSLHCSATTPMNNTSTLTNSTAAPSPPLMAYISWNGATEVSHYRFHISPLSSRGPWLPAGSIPRSGFETAANLTALIAGTPSGYALALFHKSRGGGSGSGSGSGLGAGGNFAPYVSVQALDARGKVIGSTTAQTWVPSEEVRVSANCNELGCAGATVAPPKPGTKEAAVAKAVGASADDGSGSASGELKTAGHFTYPPSQSCAEECISKAGLGWGAKIAALLVLVVALECLFLLGAKAVRACVEARRSRGGVKNARAEWEWKGEGESEGYRDEEGAGAGGGAGGGVGVGVGARGGAAGGRRDEVKWSRDVLDETPRAAKGTRRPSVKRSKSGWEEPGKPVVLLKASGHEA